MFVCLFVYPIVDQGEMVYTAIEQKRYEECSVVPGPDNDVIVAIVLVISTDTLVTTLKMSGKEDWPQALTAFALGSLFKTIQFNSQVNLIA
jgi:hypothetical protein